MAARGLSLTAPMLALALTGMWSADRISASTSADGGFERILAKSNTVAPPSYRAYRRMEGGLNDSDRQGWLEVWTEYTPARGFRYDIVREGGSDYVRNKVLRGMLASEERLIATGKRLRASLEAMNYIFEDGGTTDTGLQRVMLKPAKKSDGILNGSLLLDPGSGLITRLEGRLVKSPSFWVRDVDLTYKFAHIGGHVVPIEMSSTGRVRMFGRSSFKMVYDYVSIDGQPTSLKASLRDDQVR